MQFPSLNSIIIFTLLFVAWPPVAYPSQSKEDALKEVIKDLAIDRRYQDIGRVDELQNTYKNTSSLDSKKYAALALGVHFLADDPKLALQYLSSAKLMLAKNDPVSHVVDYYLSVAKLRLGDYRGASEISASLSKNPKAKVWQDKILPVKIEALFQQGDYSKVFKAYKAYSKKHTLNRRQEEIIRYVAMSFEKAGKVGATHEIIEDLSRNYPMTKQSRWAFRKLVDASCRGGAESGNYVFSKKLLIRLSRNTSLDTGLADLLKELIEGEILVSKNEVRVLDDLEKLQLLFRMRFYKDALKLARGLLDHHSIKANPKDHEYLLVTIGRIYLRLNDPIFAARYLSQFIAEYPESGMAYRAYSYMGDALSQLGYYEAAAGQYAIAAKDRRARTNRWTEFWHLYRGGDYDQALVLLNRRNYVKPKDKKFKGSLSYWKAKILLKLGREADAKRIFSKLLTVNANSYYAQLVAAEYPSILRDNPALVAKAPSKKRLVKPPKRMGFSLASKILSGGNLPTPIKSEGELGVVENLIGVGLQESARLELRSISWENYREEDSFAAISKLAWMIDNYQSSRSLKFRKFSALRRPPSDWWNLLTHQKAHTAEWQVYFPLAYNQVLERVTRNVNVNKFFVLSIMRAESRYRSDAKSWVGARGLMQIMPYTGIKIARSLDDHGFEVESLGKPEINVSYGSYYLNMLVDYDGGNKFLAAAGYNAGPAAVNKWLERCKDCSIEEFVESIPYRETRQYVKKVVTYFAFYQRIYEGKLTLRGLPDLPAQLPEGVEIF